MLYGPIGLADGVIAGGTGRNGGNGGSLEIILDGDKSARHVYNEGRDEERGHPTGALLQHKLLLLLKGADATYAGAKVYAYFLRGQGTLYPAGLHRLGGGSQGILAEHIIFAELSLLIQVPMKRMGSPEDVANVALFLASPESDYITGETIRVDGGLAT